MERFGKSFPDGAGKGAGEEDTTGKPGTKKASLEDWLFGDFQNKKYAGCSAQIN